MAFRIGRWLRIFCDWPFFQKYDVSEIIMALKISFESDYLV